MEVSNFDLIINFPNPYEISCYKESLQVHWFNSKNKTWFLVKMYAVSS